MKIIETYSGSKYLIDEINKTFRRLPGDDANSLNNDEKEVKYEYIISMNIDESMKIIWKLNGIHEKVRITTPIKSISEVENE